MASGISPLKIMLFIQIILISAVSSTIILGLDTFLNSIVSCQVHLVFDTLTFTSLLKIPISIYKTFYEEEDLGANVSTLTITPEPTFNILQGRGFHCQSTIIFFSDELPRLSLDGKIENKKPITEVLENSHKRLHFPVIECYGVNYDIEECNVPLHEVTPFHSYYLYLTKRLHWESEWMVDLYSWTKYQAFHFRKYTGGFLVSFVYGISSNVTTAENKVSLGFPFYFFCFFCSSDQYPNWIALPVNESTLSSRVHLKQIVSRHAKLAKWALKEARGFPPPDKSLLLLQLPTYITNPFRIPKDKLVLFDPYIVHLLISYDNSSVAISSCSISDTCRAEIPFLPQIKAYVNLACGLGDKFVSPACKNIFSSVAIETETLSFLTCYSIPEPISFKKYLQPFHFDLWISLILIMPVIAGIIHIIMAYIKYPGLDFNPYLFMLSSAFDHSHGIPTVLQEYFQFRIIIGLWLLISVIFTNAYRGIAITEITSPIARESATHFEDLSKQEVQTSYELFGVTHDLPPIPENFQIISKIMPNVVWEPFKNLTKPAEVWLDHVFTFRETLMYLYRSVYSFYLTGRNENLTKLHQTYINLYVRDSFKEVSREHNEVVGGSLVRTWLSESTAIERDLLKAEKTVYVDTTRTINQEVEYLRKHYQHTADFFTSKQPIYEHNVGYTFDYPIGSNVPDYFVRLVQSGIYLHLEKHFTYQSYRNRLKYTRKFKVSVERFVPVKLHSNIQTVFYLYFIAISFCMIRSATEQSIVKTVSFKCGCIIIFTFKSISKFLNHLRLL